MRAWEFRTAGRPEKGKILAAKTHANHPFRDAVASEFSVPAPGVACVEMWCMIHRRQRGPHARADQTRRSALNKLALAFGSAAIALLASCATAPEPAAPAPAPAPVQHAPRPAASAPAPAPVHAPGRRDAEETFHNEETFPFAKDKPTSAAKGRLDRDVLGRLAACASVEAVVVEGHADRLGSQ